MVLDKIPDTEQLGAALQDAMLKAQGGEVVNCK
jgi:hypothetical protein